KQQVEVLKRQVAALLTTVQSQSAQITSLQTTVNTQSSQISTLQTTVQNQASQIAALGSRADTLETKTQYMSVANGDTIFEGTNLIVRSGTAPSFDLNAKVITFTPN